MTVVRDTREILAPVATPDDLRAVGASLMNAGDEGYALTGAKLSDDSQREPPMLTLKLERSP